MNKAKVEVTVQNFIECLSVLYFLHHRYPSNQIRCSGILLLLVSRTSDKQGKQTRSEYIDSTSDVRYLSVQQGVF